MENVEDLWADLDFALRSASQREAPSVTSRIVTIAAGQTLSINFTGTGG